MAMVVHADAVPSHSFKFASFCFYFFFPPASLMKHLFPMRDIHPSTLEMEVQGLNLEHCIFETITANGTFSPTKPDQPDCPRRRGRIRAISPACTQDCSWLMSGHRKIKWTKQDSWWPGRVKSEAVVSMYLQRLVSTTSSRPELLHLIGAWCSNELWWIDSVLICRTFNVKMLTVSSSLTCRHHLHSSRHKFKKCTEILLEWRSKCECIYVCKLLYILLFYSFMCFCLTVLYLYCMNDYKLSFLCTKKDCSTQTNKFPCTIPYVCLCVWVCVNVCVYVEGER